MATTPVPSKAPHGLAQPGRGIVCLIIGGTSLGPLAVNLLLPAMPHLVVAFRSDVETVQLTLSLYLFGFAVSQLAHGPLSDHFGRRPVMIAGFALTFVASLGALSATSIGWIVAARVLQAIGASAGVVVGRAIIRDVYDRDEAAAMIGWVTIAMLTVPMISPSIGGVLDTTFGWESIFVCIGAVSAALFIWAALALPETRAAAHGGGGVARFRRETRALLGDRVFIGYALATGFGSATFFSFLGGAPHVVIGQMGRSSAEYGLWFPMAAVAYACGNFITARWSARVGSARMALWGTILATAGGLVMALSVIAFPVSAGPTVIFVPQLLVSLAYGLTLPNVIANAVSVRPQAAGAASGIAGFMQMGVSAVMTQIVGYALTRSASPLPLAAVQTACGVVALVSLAWIVGPRGAKPTRP